jgi:DHA2 family multidrug resistance protein
MLSDDDRRWIGISFIMMLGVSLPYGIWLAERFGYKKIFFIGGCIFLFGSLLNSLSFDFWSLLISRAVAGAGAGALFPISLAIIDQNFPKNLLNIAIPLYVGLGIGGATCLAYLASGYLVQYLSWQSFFFLCFLLTIPPLIVTWLFHSETEPQKQEKFDYWGYLAFIVFIANLFLILNSAKAEWNTEGWTSNFILTSAALGVLGFLAFIFIELNHPNPIIHFKLFKKRTFFLGCVTIGFVGAVLYATLVFSVVFFDFDLHYEKHRIGLFLAPQGFAFGFFAAIVAALSKKISIRLLTLIGMALVTVSCFMNSYITIYSSHSQLAWMWYLRYIGIGLSLGPATAFALSEIPVKLSGAAAVLIIFARQVGGTLGTLGTDLITIVRTVFHNARFGAQVDVMGPRFEQVSARLQAHLVHDVGMAPQEAQSEAIALIRNNVMTQSHATSINDAFYIYGIILGTITAALIIEAIWSAYDKKTMNLSH